MHIQSMQLLQTRFDHLTPQRMTNKAHSLREEGDAGSKGTREKFPGYFGLVFRLIEQVLTTFYLISFPFDRAPLQVESANVFWVCVFDELGPAVGFIGAFGEKAGDGDDDATGVGHRS